MVNLLQILFPLYIWPVPGAWDPLYNSISANPSVQFNLVINQNSGPGSSLNSDQIPAISKLNSYPNTNLFGYVHTSWATRPESEVKAEIDTYAHWQDNAAGDLHMDGIFFDEAVANYNSTTGAYMSSITTYARNTLYNSGIKVIFNPGTNPSPKFYDIGDSIVAVESPYNEYSSQTIPSIPARHRSQASVLLHHFSGSLNDQKKLVNDVASAGIGSIFVTEYSRRGV